MRNRIAKAFQAAKLWAEGHRRSPHWPSVRRAHLAIQPDCQWCGSQKDPEVHHVLPFHLDPAKELDPSNLITLCETMGVQCHLRHGHNGNWQHFNPQIRQDCEREQRLGPC